MSHPYQAVHNRLGKEYGPARLYRCVGCGKRAQEWALSANPTEKLKDPNNDLPYSTNPDDYLAMCRHCHRKQDNSSPWKRSLQAARAASRKSKPKIRDRKPPSIIDREVPYIFRRPPVKTRRCSCGLDISVNGWASHQGSRRHYQYLGLLAEESS